MFKRNNTVKEGSDDVQSVQSPLLVLRAATPAAFSCCGCRLLLQLVFLCEKRLRPAESSVGEVEVFGTAGAKCGRGNAMECHGMTE